jgi:peptide-methionine (R)-S-oxide reductase
MSNSSRSGKQTGGYWRENLTEEQFAVCRLGATEAPFTGEHYARTDPGTYLCVACGQELFSSENKYKSGDGWPSFWGAIKKENINFKEDLSHGMIRTEITCSKCNSHLGHIFPDGPGPTKEHYCVNSIALKFVPKENASA